MQLFQHTQFMLLFALIGISSLSASKQPQPNSSSTSSSPLPKQVVITPPVSRNDRLNVPGKQKKRDTMPQIQQNPVHEKDWQEFQQFQQWKRQYTTQQPPVIQSIPVQPEESISSKTQRKSSWFSSLSPSSTHGASHDIQGHQPTPLNQRPHGAFMVNPQGQRFIRASLNDVNLPEKQFHPSDVMHLIFASDKLVRSFLFHCLHLVFPSKDPEKYQQALDVATQDIVDVEKLLHIATLANEKTQSGVRKMFIGWMITGRMGSLETLKSILGRLSGVGNIISAVPIVGSIVSNPIVRQVEGKLEQSASREDQHLKQSLSRLSQDLGMDPHDSKELAEAIQNMDQRVVMRKREEVNKAKKSGIYVPLDLEEEGVPFKPSLLRTGSKVARSAGDVSRGQ